MSLIKEPSLIKELDYGTPIRVAEKQVSLTIDGEKVTVPAGTSVMAAAMSRGVKIPKLCASDNLEPFGSCRLCLVEIEGRRGTPASCTTPAEEGMVVRTQSEKLARLRRGVMELYLSDYPGDVLASAGGGEFLDAAARGRPARGPLCLRRREPFRRRQGRIQSLFRL